MKRGAFVWAGILCTITTFLIIPATNQLFSSATSSFPYLMGFIKFALLATMGEFLAIRITSGRWKPPSGFFFKAVIWGFVGVLIVFMFQLFPAGVAATIQKGYLPMPGGWSGKILTAFVTSALMNLTFAPVFMSVHRFTDSYIDSRFQGEKKRASEIITIIDWPDFIKFVLCKTIPLFWIPAHTISFLLPEQYRVLFASFLSIALGAILAYARRRKTYA